MRGSARVAAAVLAAAVVLLAPTAAEAQSQSRYTVQSATFLPQVFYVGDRVELRLRLRLDPGVQVSSADTAPRVEWGTVHAVTAVQQDQDAEVRIQFTAFRQGTLALPPLRLGDITVGGLDVYVESILEEGQTDLAPLRGQSVLPSTNLLIAGGVSIAVLLPLVWIFFVRFGRSRLRRIVEHYRANQPARRLRKEIRQLDSEIEGLAGRSFYIALLEDLRTYVSQKLGVDCMSATTNELRGYLDQLISNPEDREALIELFQFGDLVKFARGKSPVKQRRRHLETVQHIVEKIERHHRAKRRERNVGAA